MLNYKRNFTLTSQISARKYDTENAQLVKAKRDIGNGTYEKPELAYAKTLCLIRSIVQFCVKLQGKKISFDYMPKRLRRDNLQ